MFQTHASATACRSLPRGRPRSDTVAWARSLFELTKPRLAAMSVLTTATAYFAEPGAGKAPLILGLIGGTALSAGGALALNQWRERDTDGLMSRTMGRPLPMQTLPANVALAWSSALAAAGVCWLASAVSVISATISALTIVLYAFVYTPLKRRTRWATEIGAISGALPPLIGSGADGTIAASGWTLFAMIFLWQMPHFFAIGWVCRRDYQAAGFPLLPAVDADGARTAGWTLGYASLLAGAPVIAFASGAVGYLFAAVATVAGLAMLMRAWQFAVSSTTRDVTAKRLFLASLAYLPLVLIALIVETHR